MMNVVNVVVIVLLKVSVIVTAMSIEVEAVLKLDLQAVIMHVDQQQN